MKALTWENIYLTPQYSRQAGTMGQGIHREAPACGNWLLTPNWEHCFSIADIERPRSREAVGSDFDVMHSVAVEGGLIEDEAPMEPRG